MRNSEHYYDPTAEQAFINIELDDDDEEDKKDSMRFHKLLRVIFDVCEIAGFHVEGRITLKDKKTGKIWR